MESKKIQVVSSSGMELQQLYRSQPDFWSKLRGQDDFRNLDSTKFWELLGVSMSELLATAILVGIGCSSAVTGMEGTDEHVSPLIITLTFTCTATIVVIMFGHISGCHVNPAVSLSAMLFGNLSLPRFLIYMVSQCLGSIVGIATVRSLAPEGCAAGAFCVTLPHSEVGVVKAIIIEAILTGILVGLCASVWDRRCQDKQDSLPIKFTLSLAALVFPGAKFTGASLNPARSLGPVLLSGHWENHWIYWVGPIGGSIVATAFYKAFFSEVNPPDAVPSQPPQEEEEVPL